MDELKAESRNPLKIRASLGLTLFTPLLEEVAIP